MGIRIFWMLFIGFMVTYVIYVLAMWIQPLKDFCILFNVETWFIMYSVFLICVGVEIHGYERGKKECQNKK